MSRRQQRQRTLRRRTHMAVASGGVAAVASLGAGGVAHAAQTFSVTNLNDSGPGSLRQAITEVNTDASDTAAPGDSIVFASSLSGTLALSTAANPKDTFYIQRPVQIAGPGANQVTVEGLSGHRVFAFDPTSGVTAMAAELSGLTINGGSYPGGAGAGIDANKTTLELDRMTVSNNRGMFISGVDVFGTGATLVMNDSTVTGNAASSTGGTGGVYSEYGGSINNSTISGNTGGVGAGVASYGPLEITGSTVAGNAETTPDAGQILDSQGVLTLRDSIVAGSGSLPDVVLETGATGSASFSLIRDPSPPSGDTAVSLDATDITGLDPQLGPLQLNGGPTATMVPQLTSPVLDRGKSFGLTTDQRGLPRPFVLPTVPASVVPAGGDRSDIGAVEEETPGVAALSPTSGRAGSSVAIAGTGFTSATQVLFGSIPASSFKVFNDGVITAVAPLGAGSENIRVITPLGESPIVGSDRFAFPTFKPTVTKHPRAKLSGKKVNTGIKVGCPSGGLSCKGSFKATAFINHHKTRLAKGSISLSAGHGKTLTFKLGSKALKQLKTTGKLKITIQIVIADGSEKRITVNRTITLKRKAKKH
jgi:hypothetical protein